MWIMTATNPNKRANKKKKQKKGLSFYRKFLHPMPISRASLTDNRRNRPTEWNAQEQRWFFISQASDFYNCTMSPEIFISIKIEIRRIEPLRHIRSNQFKYIIYSWFITIIMWCGWWSRFIFNLFFGVHPVVGAATCTGMSFNLIFSCSRKRTRCFQYIYIYICAVVVGFYCCCCCCRSRSIMSLKPCR